MAKVLASNKTSLAKVADFDDTIAADGYYLFVDTYKSDGESTAKDATSKYILAVLDADATEPLAITLKNSAPSVIKKVKEDDKAVTKTGQTFAGKEDYDVGAGYNDVADYCIGETIPFKLYGTLPSTLSDYSVYYYEFTDSMADTLEMDSTSVKVAVSGVEKELTAGIDYTLTVEEDKHGFSVKFADILKLGEGVTANSIVTVEYNAKLTSDAVIGLDGQQNEVDLTYSTNPNFKGDGDTDEKDEHGKTPKDKVIVFTYEVDTVKVDGSDNTKTLAGAKFKLGNEDGNKWAVVKNGKFVSWADSEAGGTELTTPADGKIQIAGLDSGTYKLRETEAPAGYNTPTDDFTVVLTATTVNNQTWNETPAAALTAISGTVAGVDATVINNSADKIAGIEGKIANNSGASLPSTGGIGTTIFYLGGGAMVAVAGVFLITKKRMGKSEN